eukprot:9190334-Karenia_brevis.AAC.1
MMRIMLMMMTMMMMKVMISRRSTQNMTAFHGAAVRAVRIHRGGVFHGAAVRAVRIHRGGTAR